MTLAVPPQDSRPVPARFSAPLRLVTATPSAPSPQAPADACARATVDSAVREVMAGTGSRVLVLEGPRGATVLSERALRRAQEARASVVRHRVAGLDRVVPLAALRALVAELPRSGPFRTEQDLAEVLTVAASRAPVAVVLDDVDRCDQPTARVLDRLIGAVCSAPVLWVLTRQTSRPALPSAQHLYVLQERSHPSAAPAPGIPACATPEEASRVRRRLSAPARRALDALVVLDRPATCGELAGVIGLDASAVGSARCELLGAGLLVDRTDVLALHPGTTAALMATSAPAVRAVLHRAVAGLPGTGPDERVAHLLRGGCVPDIRPGKELERVVEDRAVTDPAGAAALVLHTLDLLPAEPDAPDRARLLASGIRLLCRSGDPLRATVLAAAADTRWPDPALALAEATFAAGRAAEARTRIEQALATDPPLEFRQRLQVLSVHVSVALNDPAAARRCAATLPADVPGARGAQACAALATGDLDRAGATLGPEPENPAEPDRRDRPGDWRHRVQVLLARDDPAAAARSLAAARPVCRAVHLPGWYLRVAETRMAAGRLGAAAAAANYGLRLESRWAAVTLALHAVAAELALVTGRADQARDHLRHLRHLRAAGVAAGPRPGWVALQLAVDDGSSDAAELLDAIDLVQLSMLEPRAPVEVVRAFLGAGAPDRARDVAENARELASRCPGRGRRAAAEHATGLAHGDTAAIARAATAWHDAGRPLPAAHAQRDVADLTDDRGCDGSASRRAAAAILRGCGATAVADRLDREADTSHRVDPGWSSLTAAELRVVHQVALGRSNREVASALCLSRHTVDTHLRHVFAKLGVTNRVALTAVAHARGSTPLT